MCSSTCELNYNMMESAYLLWRGLFCKVFLSLIIMARFKLCKVCYFCTDIVKPVRSGNVINASYC